MVCIFNLFLKINQSVSLFSTEFVVIFEHNIFLFRFLFYRQMTQRVLSCPVFSYNTTLLQAGGAQCSEHVGGTTEPFIILGRVPQYVSEILSSNSTIAVHLNNK